MATTDLCYCKPGFTGHVHAARLSAEEWARGILAMADLARDSQVPWLAGLPKAERQARKILQKRSRSK